MRRGIEICLQSRLLTRGFFPVDSATKCDAGGWGKKLEKEWLAGTGMIRK